MVSQDNESSKDFTAIECKLRILHMFQLQREIECNRGFESEDDDDDYESEDDDDYDTQDDDEYDTEEDTQDDSEDEDDAEHTLEKETSPRRYRTSEFPLFSPTFWGNCINGNESTKPGVTPVMKDTSAGRYRTSEFPLFSQSFWGESTKGKGMTEDSSSLTTKGKDCINPVPRAHEGHKLVPAHQPLGMALTFDDIGVEQRSPLEKKVERMVSDNGKSSNSVNKYRGIPTFRKVRQKSLPPISKRQECHMTTRQKSLPPIEKRRKPKTAVTYAFNKEDTTGRSRTAETMPVLARDLNLPPRKPRFQGGPYQAKPYKLLPPIVTKSEGKKNAKDKNNGDDTKKKGNPNPIKVRHTKKSAQIEQKAKAKRDAENDGRRKASANVKPPLARVPVSSAPKSKSIASCITVPDWSTRKHKKSTLPLPPIRCVKDTSNASSAKIVDTNAECSTSNAPAYVGVTSVVAAMSEKMDTTKATINEVQISSSRESSPSRSSKSSRSSGIKRSRRDHRSRSLSSRSSSSTRSKKSTRVSMPCRSHRSNCASRSDSPRELKKSARVSTTGSRTSTNRGDTSERSGYQASCTPDESMCDSRRSRRDKKRRSPSPLSSGRSSHPGSPHMKDKSDGNAPDSEYDYSPMSTARSSVHTNRSQLSDTARTCSSASNASRNMSTVKSTGITCGSSNMQNVPKPRPTSQSKRESTRQHIPSRPNTAPVSQIDVVPHPNTASSYPNSARHNSISVRPNTAALLRQKSISSRQSIAPKRQSTDSIHRGTASGRQSITSVRPSIAQTRPSTAGVRPNTTSTRQATEQNRPTTAPPHPRTAAVRPTTALVSPTTALSHHSTTPSHPSTTSRSKIPIRIVTSPGKTSARSAIPSARSAIPSARSAIPSTRSPISSARSAIPSAYSARSTCSRNKTAVLKMPLAVPN